MQVRLNRQAMDRSSVDRISRGAIRGIAKLGSQNVCRHRDPADDVVMANILTTGSSCARRGYPPPFVSRSIRSRKAAHASYPPSSATPTLSSWEGGKIGEDIILYREQKAPNGMEGYYKITFKEITESGFNWLGEWVTLDESFKYPTWKIYCTKRKQDK